MTADVWGISIPIVAGLMVVGTSAVCIWKSCAAAKQLYTPLACLIGCAITFVFTQVLIHEASLSDQTVRSFVIWILQLMLVYALCLRRNFFLRYPIVLFLIGLTTLPFFTIMPGEVERTRVDAAFGGNLASLGGLGDWFGFCATFFSMVAVTTERPLYRVVAACLTVGCLFVVTVTVDRGPLIAAAIAIVVGCRRLLRRGFLPVLLGLIFIGAVYESGLFEKASTRYAERGMEETGREKLWPDAFSRFIASPVFGVGDTKVGTDVLGGHNVATPPHNTFSISVCPPELCLWHYSSPSGFRPFGKRWRAPTAERANRLNFHIWHLPS